MKNRENIDLLACELLARKLHAGDVDKQGVPYIRHLEVVAATLELRGAPWQSIAAGWLHDAVEDGKITETELRAAVPGEVANLVMVLTRRKGTETYAEYIQRVAQTPTAIPIKLADLEHNLERSRTLPSDEGAGLRRRYQKAQRVLLERLESLKAEGRV